MAKLFRQVRQLGGERPCDLDSVLLEDGIEASESRCADPGYTACLIRLPLYPGGGIFLAPGQGSGRRRFSIAHELAHFHIPAHKSTHDSTWCTERDMRARDCDAAVREWEANDFAAELLMPSTQFAADAAKKDVSFSTVYWLSDASMYHVSVVAAAWRLVQISRQACALVVASDGRVDWVARSREFVLPLPERRQQLQATTLAASAVRGEGARADPEPIDTAAWIESVEPVRGRLLESTHTSVRWNQVLSLLWYLEDDGDQDE